MASSNALNLTSPVAASTTSGTSGTSSSSSQSSTATTNIGSTFLNLLTQELQNQDPTAPMDSTAMVGQMISLNQLDQLIAINGDLGGSSSSSSATSGSKSSTAQAALAGNNTTSGTGSQATAASQSLPFDPTTMLPVGYTASNAITNALSTPLTSSIPTAAQAAASAYGIY